MHETKTIHLHKNCQNLSKPIGIFNIIIGSRGLKQVKQDRQCTHNVILTRVHATIVTVEKQ